MSSSSSISLSHVPTTLTTTTTVTFYTNALGDKHKLNKPHTIEFPTGLLTAEYALSLLSNTALLKLDATFTAYDHPELDKLRLSADAAVHLTLVRWHLLGASPSNEQRKSMVERQRLVCGCDNPSYLQCRIRAYAAIQRRGGKPDVRCTRFQKLPVTVTSSPTLLDLLLAAIETQPDADLLDLSKTILASYPEITTVHEIRFNDGIEYKISREVGGADGADDWVQREMLWRIESNRAHIIAFDKGVAKEVDFITACPGNAYQVNWRDDEAHADKVTHNDLVLLGWTDKVYNKAAAHLDVGTCVTIDGEVGEIVKVQKGRGSRSQPIFDVRVADKTRAKVKTSQLKPAAYEVQELVDGLVDTAKDDGVKLSLQRVRMLLRALLPAPPTVGVMREEKEAPREAEEDADGEEVEKEEKEAEKDEEDAEEEDAEKEEEKKEEEKEERRQEEDVESEDSSEETKEQIEEKEERPNKPVKAPLHRRAREPPPDESKETANSDDRTRNGKRKASPNAFKAKSRKRQDVA